MKARRSSTLSESDQDAPAEWPGERSGVCLILIILEASMDARQQTKGDGPEVLEEAIFFSIEVQVTAVVDGDRGPGSMPGSSRGEV